MCHILLIAQGEFMATFYAPQEQECESIPLILTSGTPDFQDEVRQLFLVAPVSRVHCWRYRRVKRAIDLMAALMMLAVCLIPGLLIVAAIALTSGGEVFYNEIRLGRGGRPFRIWKFRSMCHKPRGTGRLEAVPCPDTLARLRTHKDVPDPRITRIGGFLRRWSLDELPQLFNVLRGEMSLVGPRPIVAAELPLYGPHRGAYLAATPGLSGLWQVSGRSNVSFASRAQLDASYVRSWSLRADFSILLRTVPAVLRQVGAR